MRTDTERLLDNLTTPVARLRGVAGVHSDDLMTSSCSLLFKNVEECTPGGIHDGFRQMMVINHIGDLKVFYRNPLIAFSIGPGSLEMEVTALAFDLEMGLGGAPGSLASTLRTLLTTRYRALLAPQSGLALAIVAGVLNRVPIAVSEERRKSYIKTNVRMLTHRWGMLVLWLCFTDNESVPVSIASSYQVTGLRYSFDGPMQFDLEGCTQLLGDTKMFAIGGKLKVRLVLTQWNGVPSYSAF